MTQSWLAGLLTLAEIGLLTLACFALLRRGRYGLAASMSLAVTLVLALLSCLIQAAFLIGAPPLLWLAEAVLAVQAVRILLRDRRLLAEASRRLRGLCCRHRALAAALAAIWLYLFLQVLLLPPGNNDSLSYNLARVLLFQQDGTLFLERFTDLNQAFQPVGHDILAHLFLRFHTDYGIAVFSLLEYLAIVAGVYALGRRWVAEFPALTAAVVVAGLPTLVYQATSTKNDLATAACAAAALLLAQRLLDRPSGRDAALLLVVLAFGVSAKATFVVFAGPFAVVFAAMFLASHRRPAWTAELARRRGVLAVAFAVSAVLSQGWLFLHSLLRHGGPLGPPEWTRTYQNPDGLAGGLANLCRYLLQTVSLPRPVEPLVERLTGIQPSRALEAVWERGFEPLLGSAGTTEWPFRVLWLPHEDVSWFGPLGFLLVLPAILWGLARGPKMVRATSAVLVAYALLISLQVAWMQWNGRFFSLVAAAGGLPLALVLARRRPAVLRLVQIASIALLLYAAAFNRQKPLIRHFWESWPQQLAGESIWAASDWGRDRLFYAERHFGDRRVEEILARIPRGAEVGLVTSRAPVYALLLGRPDVTWHLGRPDRLGGPVEGFGDAGIVLCLENGCPAPQAGEGVSVVWEARPGSRPAQLAAVAAQAP